jgi:hypothetical protein
MIPVQHNPTVYTDVCAYTEIFMLTFLMAGAADLAGLAWVHLHDGDTGAFCLVLHQLYEVSPPSIKYRLVQTALCGCPVGQVFAILILLRFWLAHHIVHREVLKDDGLKGFNQYSGLFMMEVLPLVTYLLMSLGYGLDGFLPAITPLLYLLSLQERRQERGTDNGGT